MRYSTNFSLILLQTKLTGQLHMTEKAIIENIAERLGITTLNPMQLEMLADSSKATVLLAPTGSGKTIAFAGAMLRKTSNQKGTVQAVVLSPSRELALQTYEVIRPIATGLKTTVLRGGHAVREEQNSLSVVPDIVIATPGRLLDHARRGRIDLSTVDILVVDEYDKQLELGFEADMKALTCMMKKLIRVILTSATPIAEMPTYIPLADKATVITGKGVPGAKTRLQKVHIESPARDKLDTLVDLLRSLKNGKVIIFVNHRESATRVYEALKSHKLPIGLYHGGMEQAERELAIDLLNNGSTPILVSTDLASRGLDIDAVDAVIHYHLPPSAESWTHRNGRTARQNAEGTVYVITSEADSIPDYVEWDREYVPTGKSPDPIRTHVTTLYLNLGKKEKISKGDVAGFVMVNTGLTPDQVGPIVIKDHSAIVAVPKNGAKETAEVLGKCRLKGKKVRVTELRR